MRRRVKPRRKVPGEATLLQLNLRCVAVGASRVTTFWTRSHHDIDPRASAWTLSGRR